MCNDDLFIEDIMGITQGTGVSGLLIWSRIQFSKGGRSYYLYDKEKGITMLVTRRLFEALSGKECSLRQCSRCHRKIAVWREPPKLRGKRDLICGECAGSRFPRWIQKD